MVNERRISLSARVWINTGLAQEEKPAGTYSRFRLQAEMGQKLQISLVNLKGQETTPFDTQQTSLHFEHLAGRELPSGITGGARVNGIAKGSEYNFRAEWLDADRFRSDREYHELVPSTQVTDSELLRRGIEAFYIENAGYQTVFGTASLRYVEWDYRKGKVTFCRQNGPGSSRYTYDVSRTTNIKSLPARN